MNQSTLTQNNINNSASLFNLVQYQLDGHGPIVQCTKTTLTHLVQKLEKVIVDRRIPALLFIGSPGSHYFLEETDQTQALAQVAQQVCIFSATPSSAPLRTPYLHINLDANNPLQQEYFFVTLSASFGVVLCARTYYPDHSDGATTQMDTIWSFEPAVVQKTVDLLAKAVAIYHPDHVDHLQLLRTNYSTINTDLTIISQFMQEIIRFEEALKQDHRHVEEIFQQDHSRLEAQVTQRTLELAETNEQLKQEIAQRQQVQEALVTEHNLLRTLLDNLPDLIFVKDRDSRFLAVNRALMTRGQHQAYDEIIGKTDWDLHPAQLAAQYYADDQAVIQTGQPLIDREEMNIALTGEAHWFSTTKVPLQDSQGSIVGLVGMSRDITERKKAEAELERYRDHLEDLVIARTSDLRAANQKLQREIAERQRAEAEREGLLAAEHEQRLLAETMREVTLALASQIDHTAVLDEILRQTQRLVPYKTANITLLEGEKLRVASSSGYEAFYSQEFMATLTQPLADLPLDNAAIQVGSSLIVRDTHYEPHWTRLPETTWIRSSLAVPLYLHDRVLGLLRLDSDTPNQFSAVDAERLQALANAAAVAIRNAQLYEEAQQRLKEQKTLLEAGVVISSTLELNEVLNLVAEQMGRALDVTSSFISHYDPINLTSATLAAYFAPEVSPLERVADFGVYYDLNDFPRLRDAISNKRPVTLQVNDPTLTETERTSLKTYGGISVLELPLQIRGQVIAIAALWESRRQREFTGNEIALGHALAQQAAISIENARLYAKTQTQARQLEQILSSVKAGILLIDSHHRLQVVNTVGQEYLSVLGGGEIGQVCTQLGSRHLIDLLTPSDASPYHEISPVGLARPIFEVTARSVVGGPEAEGWVIVIRDVTEERDIQKRIQQQEKLAAVGQLAAGIAHDFNNILTSIIGFAELARYTPDVPSTVSDDLEHIVQQGQRAAHLVRQILDFARKNISAKKSLEFTTLLKEVVKLLERTLPETIQIKLEIDPTRQTYPVRADLTQVQQALTNLAINSADAMPLGGILQLQLTSLALQPGQRAPWPDMSPGEWLVLAVTDTGIGIPVEIQAHIFEPFFTTKEVGQGTGLGLAQVDGIIKQHGGYITVNSQVGEGATFTLYLPLLNALPAGTSTTPVMDQFQGHGETILLVEDDASVLRVIETVLERLGYRVITAQNGRIALALYEQYQPQIALVITDLTMPEMGGLVLADALVAKDAKVKVLAITGYPLKMPPQELHLHGIIDWLHKPLNLDQLAQKLKQYL